MTVSGNLFSHRAAIIAETTPTPARENHLKSCLLSSKYGVHETKVDGEKQEINRTSIT